MLRLGPIVEHHRNGGKHLHVHGRVVALFKAHGGSQQLSSISRKTCRRRATSALGRMMMIEANKTAVTEHALPIGKVFRENVRGYRS